MANKLTAAKSEKTFDTATGRVFADTSGNDGIKSKVGFIREAFPRRSKNDVTLVLQSCDHNVEAAMSCFARGDADSILKEWNVQQGKKWKNGNSKKKRNKKKQAELKNENNSLQTDTISATDKISEEDRNGVVEISNGVETQPKEKTSVQPLELPSPVELVADEIPSSVSSASTPEATITNGVSATNGRSTKVTTSNHNISTQRPRLERLSSAGHDVLKKSIKDLQRSSVSLARFEVLLEAECEKSFKVISKTFEKLRECLKNREELLTTQLTDFKQESVSLLKLRLENAAALKLKADRVSGMSEDDVAHLRTEIKSFVAERKIDEELAETTRFVSDEDQMIEALNNFGKVVPIKNRYKPVKLNPVADVKKTAEQKHDTRTRVHNSDIKGHHNPENSGAYKGHHNPENSGAYKGHHHEGYSNHGKGHNHQEPGDHRTHHREGPGDHRTHHHDGPGDHRTHHHTGPRDHITHHHEGPGDHSTHHHEGHRDHKRGHYHGGPGDHIKGHHHERLGQKANTSYSAKTIVGDEKPIASSESLQEAAEMHAKLQAALKQQGLPIHSEAKKQGQRNRPQKNQPRPNKREGSDVSLSTAQSTRPPNQQHPQQHRPREGHSETTSHVKQQEHKRPNQIEKTGGHARTEANEHDQPQRQRQRNRRRRDRRQDGEKNDQQDGHKQNEIGEDKVSSHTNSSDIPSGSGEDNAAGMPQRRPGSSRRRNRGRDRRPPQEVKAEEKGSDTIRDANGAEDLIKEDGGIHIQENGHLLTPDKNSLDSETDLVSNQSRDTSENTYSDSPQQDTAVKKILTESHYQEVPDNHQPGDTTTVNDESHDGGDNEQETNKHLSCSKEPDPPLLNGFINMNGITDAEAER